MKRDIGEHIVILGIILLVWFIAKAIFDNAQAHGIQPAIQSSIWTGPAIPQCDQELWKRIEDRCSR
jgi:hypothetical protein